MVSTIDIRPQTPEVEKKEPRTKPEQFADELSAEVRKSGSSKAKNFQASQLPGLLIASNGPLDGLLSAEVKNFQTSQLPDLQTDMLLALADPPTDTDLAETIEVQFTPEIRAKAQELGNNPVKIYNWVRNNIEFVPTYGSIQGANMCLQTKQCNDFDTASLLIALLRASNIHAKYVYGTIELPIEKVKNWVGGFTDTNSALTLIASGGIPVIGLTEGGQIKYVQMEHVWVETYVPYGPYSGRPSKLDAPKTWIPLDGSFKQYTYTEGINLQAAVPFDAQTFLDQIKSTLTINELEGYFTNVNQNYIQSTLTNHQVQLQNYINQNLPNATVGDILGKKEIIKQELGILPVTLPYKMIVKGAKYSSIPDSLRHKLTFNVTKDIYDELFGAPINITKSLPELAGKKITLSYSPATKADEDVINSYLPKPHPDGTPIQPNELPTSLPAYLINLKPELRIDGVVVATGTPIGMGNTEAFTMIFSGPSASANDVITNNVEAGKYLAIALDLGRVSQEQMTALKTKLEVTKAKLESQNLAGLTKDDILGDLLYTTALSYHAKVGVMNHVAAKTMGVLAITLPSETIFSSELKVNTFFGIPLSASPGGLAMDADRLLSLVQSLDGNIEKPKQFMMTVGINSSALEHSVPEQLFSTPGNQAQGISAVKALQIANEQGIPIYRINQSNINTILPQLQLDSLTIADIQNAVNAGREVTVSKTEINFNGWTGCGYIIIDPNTGAGAYMISGGLSGGWVTGLIVLITALLILAIVAVICVGSAGIGCAILILLMPVYTVGQAWLATEASEQIQICIEEVAVAHLATDAIILSISAIIQPYALPFIKLIAAAFHIDELIECLRR